MFMRMKMNSSCVEGKVSVEFRNRVVVLEAGEGLVVEHGTEHRTSAEDEAEVLCFEPAGVLNTGDRTDERFTAPGGVEI